MNILTPIHIRRYWLCVITEILQNRAQEEGQSVAGATQMLALEILPDNIGHPQWWCAWKLIQVDNFGQVLVWNLREML